MYSVVGHYWVVGFARISVITYIDYNQLLNC
jgi:hypothetical protein